ncbi:MAG: curlin repeat-containing protein [Rhodothermales bacterium]
MRTLLIALALSVAPTLAAHAQDSEQDVTTLIVQEAVTQGTTANPLATDEAFDAIADFGLLSEEGQALAGFSLGAQGNLALVRQAAFDDLLGAGNDNDASIGQDGDGNLAVLLQQGDDNFTSTLQIGSGNVIGVRLRGVGNQLGTQATPGVLQAGADNLYLLDYTGDGQTIAPTAQIGDGNQVVQIGEIDVPFGVEQRGDGMRMIIRHNGAQ